MGYCYQGRKLVCDKCWIADKVRKRRCKYGYCPAPAYCASCWKATGKSHRAYCDERCKPAALRYAWEQAAETNVLAAGGYVLRSALGRFDGSGLVDVTFCNAKGETKILAMPGALYDARVSGKVITPEYFNLE